MDKFRNACVLLGFLFSAISPGFSQTIIEVGKDLLAEKNKNYSPVIKSLLENAPKKDVRIIFQKGTYFFKPEGTFVKNHPITNHENGIKNIAFLFEGFESIEIDGGGSDFMFSGEMLPFLFDKSEKIRLTNLSIDWTVPFFIQGKVLAVDQSRGTYDLQMFNKGFDFKVESNKLKFPLSYGFTYSSIGESLVFDYKTKSPVYGAGNLDIHRKQEDVFVEKLPSGMLRIKEKLKVYPPVGSVITFKGPNGENRYAPAIHAIRSSDIIIEFVNVYHALGMGFLGERSADIRLSKFNVMLRPGTDRMLSATADATHFCNCRGTVIMEDCLFENMLDDGTNIHGIYLIVEKVLGEKTIHASLGHFQQAGFIFAESGDETWFLVAPIPHRTALNSVSSIKVLDDRLMEIHFKDKIPENLKPGDLVENKTWNTSNVIIRNCKMHNHRARNIVLKTPGKTLVENNYFSSMMASILLRAEAFFWYESGANENITIRNNTFVDCAYGDGRQAVVQILPRMQRRFDLKHFVDKNITIENNIFKTFDTQIIHATAVDGLIIRDNEIIQTSTFKPFLPYGTLIDLNLCNEVLMTNNRFRGNHPNLFSADKPTTLTLKNTENQGIERY